MAPQNSFARPRSIKSHCSRDQFFDCSESWLAVLSRIRWFRFGKVRRMRNVLLAASTTLSTIDTLTSCAELAGASRRSLAGVPIEILSRMGGRQNFHAQRIDLGDLHDGRIIFELS